MTTTCNTLTIEFSQAVACRGTPLDSPRARTICWCDRFSDRIQTGEIVALIRTTCSFLDVMSGHMAAVGVLEVHRDMFLGIFWGLMERASDDTLGFSPEAFP